MFCYEPQAKAVRNLLMDLMPIGPTDLVALRRDDAPRLAGLQDVLFIEVVGYPDHVPESIWEMLRIRGAIIWRFDDSLARAAHARKWSGI